MYVYQVRAQVCGGKLRNGVLLLVQSYMSSVIEKGRRRRLKRLIEQGHDRPTNLLYLPSEGLNEDDIHFIADELKQNDLLTIKLCISLSKIANNPIGIRGVHYLCTSPWHNLQRLELKSTKLGPHGAKEIAKAGFKSLVHLRIGFNQLGDEGVKHLTVGQWKLLQELWLQGNHIGIEGCEAISRANWKNLSHLSLWDNKINAECCKKILNLPASTFSKLDLTFCSMKGTQNSRMEEFLKLKFTNLSITE